LNSPLTSAADHRSISHAVTFLRPLLGRTEAIGDRLRTLWAGVAAARDMAAREVIEDEFFKLAVDAGLASDLGQHGEADLRHVIRWAVLGQNPFQ
jgi:hypothetical protein